MEQITLGQVAAALTFIVGFIGSVSYIHKNIKKWIADATKPRFDQVDDRIDKLDAKVEGIDLATCKNFLVARLSELEKGKPLEGIEKERFYDQYEHYKKHGGNSYITQWFEDMKERGKL